MDSTTFGGGAGAAEISSFASPLEQVFRNVPKAHEKPLRQAVYNVLAILVFGIIFYGSYYVVFVLLWPFFLPIMWALMTGLVIHPHKTSLAAAMRQTLADMAASEKTTFVAVLYGGAALVDGACEAIGGYVVAKWKMVSAIGVVFAFVQGTMIIDPTVLPALFVSAFTAFNSVSSLAVYFRESLNVLCGTIVAYLISVIVLWTPDRSRTFQYLSYILWLWLFVYCMNYVSFLYCLGAFIILKIMFRAPSTEEEGEDQVDAEDSKESIRSKRSRFRETVFAVLKRLQGASVEDRPRKKDAKTIPDNDEPVDENDATEEQPTVIKKDAGDKKEKIKEVDEEKDQHQPPDVPITPIVARPTTSDVMPPQLSSAKIEHPGVSAIRRFHMNRFVPGSGPGNNTTAGSEMFSSPHHKMMYSTPSSSRPFRKHYRTVLSRGAAGSSSEGPDGQLVFVKESDLYINLVTGCFIVLQLWIHPILLHLLPIPIAYSLIKRGIEKFGFTSDQFCDLGNRIKVSISEWFESRADVVIPTPARFVWRELARLKKAVLQALPKYSDTIVTAVLILACIVSAVFLVVFVSLQIYAESLYLVQIGGRAFAAIANSSIYQQFNATDVDGVGNNTYAKGLEEAIDSAYHYGRDYISSTVVSMLGETRDRMAVQEFETKLLELWDRIYQYWLSSRTGPSTSTTPGTFGPQVSQEAIASSAEEVFQRLIHIEDFNLSSVSQFAVNNMGTLTSVLEQGWVLLMSNASFALGVATEIIRILFLSGYGMVNFVFGVAVYFSALFYLLKVEGPVYKPVEVISSYGHLVGDGFASALNKAVNSVFTLTAKMAYFYGVWTYVTHTVFHASIVTVPVLAAAFLAAVPIAGQYLVALPAALELWLAEDRWGSAVALIVCHLVPPYVVDAAIYSEVRHGIHPWITGLSIVGGVYCFGIPGGAIYGPVILCIVYVIWTMIMYTGFLHQFGFEPPQNELNLGKSKLVLNTPLLKRSESIF